MKQGWEIKKLEEVCEMYQPKTISTKEMVDDGEYPVFGANGIIGKYDKYNHEEPQLLITCRGATCGSVNISEPKSWINGNAMVVRPKDHSIDLKFLEYLFRGGIDLSKTISGAAQPQITRQSLNPIEISYPISLPEQQRIVSILDEAFAAIAKAKANAEQNLKNAKELFESYLQGVFEKKGDGWEEKKLGEVCNVIGGGTPSKANSKFYEGDIFWATVRDMKGEIISDTEHKITKEAVKNSSTNIIPKGNVIIATRVGLGKVCLIENDTAINQDLRGIVPINPQKLSVDFLYHCLKSISHKIVEEGTGATVQGVKLPFIKSLAIPLPPINEQQTIVRQLDALRAETQKLEAVYQKKIADLEELKKSILQRAFAGELKVSEPLINAD